MSVGTVGKVLTDNDIETLQASARRAAAMLKQLANEQRLLILCKLMDEGECAVNDLASHVGLAQSATSQHLAKMRTAGLVTTRREAQTIFYRIADERAMRLLEVLCNLYAPQDA